jgi:cation diffusion facilitator CzcD-associated flavoprotein CzcO
VVLEAGPDLATSWRNHYLRLHLHTTKQHSSLPGLRFPDEVPRYPSREQVVAYLEQYAAHFGIVPRTAEPVLRIAAEGGLYTVDSARSRYRIGRIVSRLAFGDLARHGLARPELGPLSSIKLRGRIPLIDVGTVAAIKRGAIAVKPALARFTEGGAVFSDGSEVELDAAILATGYRPGLADIVGVPGALDDDGYPRHWKAGGAQPGLYFVGYEDVSTGLLREIGLQAEAVAADVAAARAGPARTERDHP